MQALVAPDGQNKRLKRIEPLDEPMVQEGKVTRLRTYQLANHYESGERSRGYTLDVVSHKGTDAVGVLPFWQENGVWRVMLLKSFRPALTFRDRSPEGVPFIYEVIAGVLEKGENSVDGILHRAREELLEEAGLRVDVSRIEPLGGAFYVSPGIYTEKIHLACVEIDSPSCEEPRRDGSVMEELLESVLFDLDEALELCEKGEIREAKTELALRRLKERLMRRERPSSNRKGAA